MATNRRGRPTEGQRITVRLAPDVIIALDRRAVDSQTTRARVLRDIVIAAIGPSAIDGVDRTQIQRMLAMSPAERVGHMTDVARQMMTLKGVAVRP